MRNPLTLKRYARRYALACAVVWLVVLAGSSRAVFAWAELEAGIVSQVQTLFTCAWIGFFVGFVGTCTGTLQSRRKLLVGRLEPSPAEWRQCESRPAHSLAWGMWLPALLAGLMLAGSLAGVQALLGWLGGLPGYPLRQFQFYTVLLPVLASGPLAAWTAGRSVERFIGASERCTPMTVSRRRYVLFHNALPYALASTAAGTAIALARFAPFHRSNVLVPVHSVCIHYLVSGLVIVVLVVAASVFKTRLDVLGPVVFSPGGVSKPRHRLSRYRFWYGATAALLIYLACEAGCAACGLTHLRASTVVAVKAALCFILAFATTAWAVQSALERFEREGLDGHPLVQVHRLLKDTGFLVLPEERIDIPDHDETERT